MDLEKRKVCNGQTGIVSSSPSASGSSTANYSADLPKNFTSVEGALVFLANAAGKIAMEDGRDETDAQEKHKNPGLYAKTGPRASNDVRQLYEDTSARTKSSDLYRRAPVYLAPEYHYLNKTDDLGRFRVPPADHLSTTGPGSASGLKNIEYIGPDGILEMAEAQLLIDLFFSSMHPFFPYIPRFLHNSETLSKYPLLLCAILTISSRYHAGAVFDSRDESRNYEIHDRLWLYVQRLMSQTVWAEASTRSMGTVFAFLLFTEWNPRAIHWRGTDYANKEGESVEEKEAEKIVVEPASIGAMKRSYRMGWMLIGSAVRLAQDTGFMDCSPNVFMATHVSEINSVTYMRRRSILAYSLAEVNLDTEDLSEEEMELKESKRNSLRFRDVDDRKPPPEETLQFTAQHKAYLELLQIMSVGHESLYGYQPQLESLDQRRILAVLGVLGPMLDFWGRKHKSLLVPTTSTLSYKVTAENLAQPTGSVAQELAKYITHESLIFEFNYTKLYIYSLALSLSPNEQQSLRSWKHHLKLDDISRSAKFIEKAFNSANELLEVANRVHSLKMLRFMPVRWVTRIVRAVAFIVKCYLSIIAHKSLGSSQAPDRNTDTLDSAMVSLSLISVEEIVLSIQKAAITMRDCSPDELHLCTRYSNVLMYLSSQMKASLHWIQSNDTKSIYEPTEKEDDNYSRLPAQVRNETFQLPHNANLPQHDTEPSTSETEVIDWFVNNKNIGLDFVGPWTELIEQQIENQNLNFDLLMDFI